MTDRRPFVEAPACGWSIQGGGTKTDRRGLRRWPRHGERAVARRMGRRRLADVHMGQRGRARGARSGRTRQPPAASRRQPCALGCVGHRCRLPRNQANDLVALPQSRSRSTAAAASRVRFIRNFGASRSNSGWCSTPDSRVLRFETDVDWQEEHKLLKVAFPVAVRSTRATYEIQFGHVERTTHTNTSWDQARFEVCAHRWADLGEPGYGVALLKTASTATTSWAPSCGCHFESADPPGSDRDRGRHRFTYRADATSGRLPPGRGHRRGRGL